MADHQSSQSPSLSTSPPPPPPPPPPTLQSTTSEPPPPPTRSSLFPFLTSLNRPKLRVTSEFDSDSLLFLNKVSCKLFDNLAKLKLSFQNNSQREVTQPQLSLTSKYLSVLYDVEEKNTFIKSTVDVSPRLQLRALHNVNAQQGEVAMEANLAEPGYSLELSSPVPIGYPRATLKFPLGEVSIQEREEEEEEEEERKNKRMLSVNGILKRQVMDGVCSALYTDEELRLRYAYKDDALSFIPTISLPSNAASFAFKRRFSPSDKLSYWYKFDSNMWSAVYKRTYGKDYKFKAGYDSEVRLGWASLWVGDEAGKVKTTPMKMKVQFMLQVPQDDIKTSVLMFRVKKRWDI
ncbi:PREDICTED: outer envelope pore protein 37, chloroplastic-like [Brassica oleracea var. oleracea]|nr:PREDICTED: outer envelope pore protein 37, chloroplastic-like [Brassica oleracea var. oleracea]